MTTIQGPILLSSLPRGINRNGKDLRRNEPDEDSSSGFIDPERLIIDNFPFIVTISNRYAGEGVERDDLFQEGRLALFRAVTSPHFDPDIGNLKSYSGRAIHNEMRRALNEQSRTIRLTEGPRQGISTVNHVRERLSHQLGKEPTIEEIADTMGVSVEEVFEIEGFSRGVTSFDQPITGSDKSKAAFIEDNDSLENFEDSENQESFNVFLELLDEILDFRQREVLIQKFGIRERESKSFEEIGRSFNLTGQAVINIYEEAVGIISRHPRFISLLSEFNNHIDAPAVSPKLSSSLKYTPCVVPVPGESTVYFRNGRTIVIRYEPAQVPNIKTLGKDARSEIKIDGIDPKMISQARAVSDGIIREISETIRLKKIYDSLGDDRDGKEAVKRELVQYPLFSKSFTTGKSTNKERFLRAYEKVLESLIAGDGSYSRFRNDVAFETLVAYFCIRPERETGFSGFPTRLIDEDDPSFVQRVQTLGRYYLVNLRGNDTPEKVEGFDKWADDDLGLLASNLSILGKHFSPPELLRVILPGYLDAVHNVHPVIREQKIEFQNKWTPKNPRVKELYVIPVQAAFEDAGLILRDGTIDLQRLENLDLTHVFLERGYFPGSAFREGCFIGSFVDVIELAAPGVFGIIPKHRFKEQNKWSEENRLNSIDGITEHIVERKLRLVTESGEVSPKKIRAVRNWATQYQDECEGCIAASGIGSVYRALRNKYKEHFGWELYKIDPADVRTPGMWVGKKGEKLFRLKFAKSIALVFWGLKTKNLERFRETSVKFSPGQKIPITLCREDLEKLLQVYRECDISWLDHIKQFRLNSPFVDLLGQSMQRAFELLLGDVNPGTGCFGESDIRPQDIVRVSNGAKKNLDLTPIKVG